MIIEFKSILLEFIQEEKTWNEICSEINHPMSVIAVALKQLTDAGEVIKSVKNNNIYFEVNHAEEAVS